MAHMQSYMQAQAGCSLPQSPSCTDIFAAEITGWAGPTASWTLLHVLRHAGDGTLSQATGSCSLLHVHCCAGDFANQIADWVGVKELYMRAGELYMEASRAPAAAQALSKGAKILEEKDPQVITGLWAGVGQCGGRDAVQGGQSELLGWRWWCPWHAASHLRVRQGCEGVFAARGARRSASHQWQPTLCLRCPDHTKGRALR